MHKNIMIIFIAALLLLNSAPILAKQAVEISENQSETSNPYIVEAGDILNIVVWKNKELSGDRVVRPDGKITIPLIGDIIAAGMTTGKISLQIRVKLKEFIEAPFVTAIVKAANSNLVYVLGEVKNPGVYTIRGSLTVLQAVALAGGFSKFANKEKMVLIRKKKGQQEKFNLSFRRIINSPDVGGNIFLLRGDTLVVP